MASKSRKRVRDDCASGPPACNSIRESLLSRAAQCPQLWCRAEKATSDAGIDGFLCALGRTVSEAVQSLADSAESSRAQLREMRAVIHAAVNARFEEVEQQVNAAEAAKSAALERELVSVDATLERWRSGYSTFRDDVAAISDSELKAHHAKFTSRLDAAEAELLLLPMAVVDPPIVALTASTSGVLAAITGCIRVIAPLSITAADVTHIVAPETTHVRPGATMELRLSLGDRHASQSDDDYDEDYNEDYNEGGAHEQGDGGIHEEGDGGGTTGVPAFVPLVLSRAERRDAIVAAYLAVNHWREARNAMDVYAHFTANNSKRVGSKHLFESLRRLLAPSLCIFCPRGTTYSNPPGTELAHSSYGSINDASAAAITAATKTAKAKNSTSVAVSSCGRVDKWHYLSRLPSGPPAAAVQALMAKKAAAGPPAK